MSEEVVPLNPQFNIMDYVGKYKWVIIGIVAVIAIGVVGYFFLVKPMMEKKQQLAPPEFHNYPPQGIPHYPVPRRPEPEEEPELEPEPEPEEDANLLDLDVIQKNIEAEEEANEEYEADEIEVEDITSSNEDENEVEGEQLTIDEPTKSYQCSFIYKSKLHKGEQCSKEGIHDTKNGPRCSTHRYQ